MKKRYPEQKKHTPDLREDAESIIVGRRSAKRKIDNSYENYLKEPKSFWERMDIYLMFGKDSFLGKHGSEIVKWYFVLIIGLLFLEIWTEETILPARFDVAMFLFAHLALTICIGITYGTLVKFAGLMDKWEHHGFFVLPLLVVITGCFWWFFYDYWIKGIFGIAGSFFS